MPDCLQRYGQHGGTHRSTTNLRLPCHVSSSKGGRDQSADEYLSMGGVSLSRSCWYMYMFLHLLMYLFMCVEVRIRKPSRSTQHWDSMRSGCVCVCVCAFCQISPDHPACIHAPYALHSHHSVPSPVFLYLLFVVVLHIDDPLNHQQQLPLLSFITVLGQVSHTMHGKSRMDGAFDNRAAVDDKGAFISFPEELCAEPELLQTLFAA